MLRTITLRRDHIKDSTVYPFTVETISSLSQLSFRSRVCFFVGENGSGKSTLLEAIAVHYGFDPDGGTRNFSVGTANTDLPINRLAKALRLSFDRKTGAGFFFRAETLASLASHVDALDQDQLGYPGTPVSEYYGGDSLHNCSHGEAFLKVFSCKCNRDGLYLLDEPEAALSINSQLELIRLLYRALRRNLDVQFIISTHSPILLGFPEAQLLSFDGGYIHETSYEQSSIVAAYKQFMSSPSAFLQSHFSEMSGLE